MVDQTFISRIERGATPEPSFLKVAYLARALGVSVEHLAGLDITPQASGGARQPETPPFRDPWKAIEALERAVKALQREAKASRAPASAPPKRSPGRRRTA